MSNKVKFFIGGMFLLTFPLIVSCVHKDTDILVKKSMAERAVVASKDSMAEFSKCRNAGRKYAEAQINLQKGQAYFSDESNIGRSKPYFEQAIKLAEEAEQEAVLCE